MQPAETAQRTAAPDDEALTALNAALSTLSVQRPLQPPQPQHLLVLDVNGLLVDRLQEAAATPPDLRYGRFFVYDRPHVRDFVVWLLQRFRVAVWSSAQLHNVEPMVQHVFGKSASALRFVWGQDRCSVDGKVRLASGKGSKPRFLKELRHVYAAGLGTEKGTCLLDDDEYKAARNRPHTALHPRPYSVAQRATDVELGEVGVLRRLLARLAEAPCVPSFIRAHGEELR